MREYYSRNYVMIKKISTNVMYVQYFGVPDVKVQVGDKSPNAKRP